MSVTSESSVLSFFHDDPEWDDRMKELEESMEQSEIERERRKRNFMQRLANMKIRIKKIEMKRINRLHKEGIIIDIKTIKSYEAEDFDVKSFAPSREISEFQAESPWPTKGGTFSSIDELEAGKGSEIAVKQENVNPGPELKKEKTLDTMSNEKMVLSVKEELEKLKLGVPAAGKQKQPATGIKIQKPTEKGGNKNKTTDKKLLRRASTISERDLKHLKDESVKNSNERRKSISMSIAKDASSSEMNTDTDKKKKSKPNNRNKRRGSLKV